MEPPARAPKSVLVEPPLLPNTTPTGLSTNPSEPPTALPNPTESLPSPPPVLARFPKVRPIPDDLG